MRGNKKPDRCVNRSGCEMTARQLVGIRRAQMRIVLLRLFDDPLRNVRRHFIVMIEFHAEDTAPLCQRTEISRILLHFR